MKIRKVEKAIISKDVAKIVNTLRIEHGSVPMSITEIGKILRVKRCRYYTIIPRHLVKVGILKYHSVRKNKNTPSLLYVFDIEKPVHWQVFENMLKEDKAKRVENINKLEEKKMIHLEDEQSDYSSVEEKRIIPLLSKEMEDIFAVLNTVLNEIGDVDILDAIVECENKNIRNTLRELDKFKKAVFGCTYRIRTTLDILNM